MSRRWPSRLAGALLALLGLGAMAPAAAEIAFKLPPPDLRGLLPLAAMPLDKPPVELPTVALPAPRQALPEPPEPRLVSELWHRPHATLPAPRALACNLFGSLGVASEQVECGRKHLYRGELDDARVAFMSALGAGDRLVAREARYWLGETLLRLGRTAEVAGLLAPVAQDDPRGEFGLHAQHVIGWLWLEDGDAARALESFTRLLQVSLPPALPPYVRHGRALALYGLKRFADAQAEWTTLTGQRVPHGLAPELNFWMGDTAGRLGDAKGALPRLRTFTAASPKILVEQGLLRHGWWSRAAGEPQEAVRVWRALLARAPASREAAWARAGLVLALLDQGDHAAARQELGQLEALDRSSALAGAAALAVRAWLATVPGRGAEARAFDDDLLARELDPPARAWVLLASAAEARGAGDPSRARDRYDVVYQKPVVAVYAWHAALGVAQIDFEARDFAGAAALAKQILGQSVPEDLRRAALLTAAEASYWAGDHAAAAEAYERFLQEFGSHPLAPQVRLAVGWAEYRRGRHAEARQRWTAFAREAPDDRRAPEALLLSAELAAEAGNAAAAEAQLREVTRRYAGTPQAELARLNRAILALADGRASEALSDLQGVEGRSAQLPLAGRVHLARGFALLAAKQWPEAQRELTAAVAQGGPEGLARLGLGMVAFERGEWPEATRALTAARDTGAPGVDQVAEYALAAARFNQGQLADFKRDATALLARRPGPAVAPHLLRGLAAVAIEDKRWPDAHALAVQLADQHRTHEAAPTTLAALAAAAGTAGEWALAHKVHGLLSTRYAARAPTLTDPVTLGETQLRAGAPAEARRTLEAFVKASPHDPRASQATLLLAEAQEAGGERLAAAETLANFAVLNRTDPKRPQALLGAGRLYQEAGRWVEARIQLERAVEAGEGAVVGEAAHRLGEGFRQAGLHDQAVEAYMTAAYLGGDTIWARRGLLGAAQSLSFLNQSAPASGLLKKLLALPDLEPEIAADARRGLKVLDVN